MAADEVTESHCRVRIAGEHEPHEHESLIGHRHYWCPGGDPPPLNPAGPYTPRGDEMSEPTCTHDTCCCECCGPDCGCDCETSIQAGPYTEQETTK